MGVAMLPNEPAVVIVMLLILVIQSLFVIKAGWYLYLPLSLTVILQHKGHDESESEITGNDYNESNPTALNSEADKPWKTGERMS